jgi:putative acetyltransferase
VDALRQDAAGVMSLVAEDAGEIVGHVMLSALDAPMPALALAPLAVVPARQRTGIGTRLVETALSIARERGWAAVVVLGDPAYYCRFGFTPEAARGFACKYAGAHLMMKALDVPVPSSGRLVYPAAFERQQW